MKTMRGRMASALLCALLVAGCGSRVAPNPDADTVAAASTESSDAPADPSAVPSVEPVPRGAEAAPSRGPAPATSPAAGAPPKVGRRHNTGVVKLALSAACVTPGSLLVVTITAPPKAGLGMVIGYSDNQAHGAMLTGETDGSGRYVWRVPVDPTVPEGDARVLVSATGPNWSQEGGGTADTVFRVSRTGC